MAHFKQSVPPNMFIFSKGVQREQDLHSWVKWFASKNIATKIISDFNGRSFLCREGEEAIDARVLQRLERKKRLTKKETTILGAVT